MSENGALEGLLQSCNAGIEICLLVNTGKAVRNATRWLLIYNSSRGVSLAASTVKRFASKHVDLRLVGVDVLLLQKLHLPLAPASYARSVRYTWWAHGGRELERFSERLHGGRRRLRRQEPSGIVTILQGEDSLEVLEQKIIDVLALTAAQTLELAEPILYMSCDAQRTALVNIPSSFLSVMAAASSELDVDFI